jgi:hypothetical protein
MRKTWMLTTIAAMVLAGSMAMQSPARAAGTVREVSFDQLEVELANPDKTVFLLILGGTGCNDCAKIDSLVADAAAKHPGDKVIKIVNPDRTTAGFNVIVPGYNSPMYGSHSFHPTSSDIDAIFAAVDQLSDGYQQRQKIVTPFGPRMNELIAAFLKPYQDQIDQQQKLMDADPQYQAVKVQIDAIYAKAGVTDLVAQFTKALQDDDAAKAEALDKQIAPKIEPFQAQLKPLIDKGTVITQPYRDASDKIREQAEAALFKATFDEKTDFGAKMKALRDEEDKLVAPVDAQIETARTALDRILDAEESASIPTTTPRMR